MWYIYIVECKDKTFYTGVTTNLKRRVEEHNDSVLGAKYTKGRRPVKLVYSVRRKDKSRAQIEECRIKKLSRAEKCNLGMPAFILPSGITADKNDKVTKNKTHFLPRIGAKRLVRGNGF